MSKVVKRKFEDQEDTERAPDADTAIGASGALNAAGDSLFEQRVSPARRVAFNAVAL